MDAGLPWAPDFLSPRAPAGGAPLMAASYSARVAEPKYALYETCAVLPPVWYPPITPMTAHPSSWGTSMGPPLVPLTKASQAIRGNVPGSAGSSLAHLVVRLQHSSGFSAPAG